MCIVRAEHSTGIAITVRTPFERKEKWYTVAGASAYHAERDP
jgi:hypothetical protein